MKDDHETDQESSVCRSLSCSPPILAVIKSQTLSFLSLFSCKLTVCLPIHLLLDKSESPNLCKLFCTVQCKKSSFEPSVGFDLNYLLLFIHLFNLYVSPQLGKILSMQLFFLQRHNANACFLSTDFFSFRP